MSFSWGPFGWINLALDLAILGLAAMLSAAVCRMKFPNGFPSTPSLEATRPLRLGLLLSLFVWVGLGAFAGGILGLSLISRSAWTLATVWTPLVGFFVWRRWRRSWLWLLVLAPLAFKYYGEAWEPTNLEVTRYRIPMAGIKEPVKIAHLSDLQTDGIRPMELRLREAANSFDPDLIVFTGDVLNHPSLIPSVAGYLKGFHRRSGAFLVSGNVDGGLPFETFSREAGFDYIDGRARTLQIGGTRLGVLGLGIEDFQNEALLRILARQAVEADVRIALSHVPDAMGIVRQQKIDLLFAGHTHGGQVCLPWLGPIITLSRVPRRIAAGGMHVVGSLRVIVSRGIGWEGHIAPRVRTFCRPQLILVELVPPKAAD